MASNALISWLQIATIVITIIMTCNMGLVNALRPLRRHMAPATASSSGFIKQQQSTALKMLIADPYTKGDGRMVVTGIGQVDADEFLLNLLNQQNLWESVVLGAEEVAPVQKRFLSRTARYSGLLNILNFQKLTPGDATELKEILEGADAWMAFNVSRESINEFADAALEANISRVIFTTELNPETLKETNNIQIIEFEEVISKFEKVNASFTGIRHPPVIEGDEDCPYEIVNASIPCLEEQVERGVLARVAAELLLIDSSTNKYCGLSSSGAFAAGYLNILRSSGLTRNQEVERVFAGGIQKVAELTVDTWEREKELKQQRIAEQEKERLEEELKLQRKFELSEPITKSMKPIKKSDDEFDEEINFEEEEILTKQQLIEKRTNDILQNVWREYNARMYTLNTMKDDFFRQNREKALIIAEKEINAEILQREQEQMEKEALLEMSDTILEVERKQYSKLLALERKEIENQKQISDTWVKYIYLLLEQTMKHCKEQNILFHNMDEFQQTILLRSIANDLRKKCNLPSYEIIYDPLDAAAIVNFMSSDEIGINVGITKPIDEVVELLNDKYKDTLKSITALRSAAQIVELAIETLQLELPKPPPTPKEQRITESQEKAKAISEKKLEDLKNRGKPFQEGETVVGKL